MAFMLLPFANAETTVAPTTHQLETPLAVTLVGFAIVFILVAAILTKLRNLTNSIRDLRRKVFFGTLASFNGTVITNVNAHGNDSSVTKTEMQIWSHDQALTTAAIIAIGFCLFCLAVFCIYFLVGFILRLRKCCAAMQTPVENAPEVIELLTTNQQFNNRVVELVQEEVQRRHRSAHSLIAAVSLACFDTATAQNDTNTTMMTITTIQPYTESLMIPFVTAVCVSAFCFVGISIYLVINFIKTIRRNAQNDSVEMRSLNVQQQIDIAVTEEIVRRHQSTSTTSLNKTALLTAAVLLVCLGMASAAITPEQRIIQTNLLDRLNLGQYDCAYCRTTPSGCYELNNALNESLALFDGEPGLDFKFELNSCECPAVFCDCDYAEIADHCKPPYTEADLIRDTPLIYNTQKTRTLLHILDNVQSDFLLSYYYDKSTCNGSCCNKVDEIRDKCRHDFLDVNEYLCAGIMVQVQASDARFNRVVSNKCGPVYKQSTTKTTQQQQPVKTAQQPSATQIVLEPTIAQTMPLPTISRNYPPTASIIRPLTRDEILDRTTEALVGDESQATEASLHTQTQLEKELESFRRQLAEANDKLSQAQANATNQVDETKRFFGAIILKNEKKLNESLAKNQQDNDAITAKAKEAEEAIQREKQLIAQQAVEAKIAAEEQAKLIAEQARIEAEETLQRIAKEANDAKIKAEKEANEIAQKAKEEAETLRLQSIKDAQIAKDEAEALRLQAVKDAQQSRTNAEEEAKKLSLAAKRQRELQQADHDEKLKSAQLTIDTLVKTNNKLEVEVEVIKQTKTRRTLYSEAEEVDEEDEENEEDDEEVRVDEPQAPKLSTVQQILRKQAEERAKNDKKYNWSTCDALGPVNANESPIHTEFCKLHQEILQFFPTTCQYTCPRSFNVYFSMKRTIAVENGLIGHGLFILERAVQSIVSKRPFAHSMNVDDNCSFALIVDTLESMNILVHYCEQDVGCGDLNIKLPDQPCKCLATLTLDHESEIEIPPAATIGANHVKCDGFPFEYGVEPESLESHDYETIEANNRAEADCRKLDQEREAEIVKINRERHARGEELVRYKRQNCVIPLQPKTPPPAEIPVETVKSTDKNLPKTERHDASNQPFVQEETTTTFDEEEQVDQSDFPKASDKPRAGVNSEATTSKTIFGFFSYLPNKMIAYMRKEKPATPLEDIINKSPRERTTWETIFGVSTNHTCLELVEQWYSDSGTRDSNNRAYDYICTSKSILLYYHTSASQDLAKLLVDHGYFHSYGFNDFFEFPNRDRHIYISSLQQTNIDLTCEDINRDASAVNHYTVLNHIRICRGLPSIDVSIIKVTMPFESKSLDRALAVSKYQEPTCKALSNSVLTLFRGMTYDLCVAGYFNQATTTKVKVKREQFVAQVDDSYRYQTESEMEYEHTIHDFISFLKLDHGNVVHFYFTQKEVTIDYIIARPWSLILDGTVASGSTLFTPLITATHTFKHDKQIYCEFKGTLDFPVGTVKPKPYNSFDLEVKGKIHACSDATYMQVQANKLVMFIGEVFYLPSNSTFAYVFYSVLFISTVIVSYEVYKKSAKNAIAIYAQIYMYVIVIATGAYLEYTGYRTGSAILFVTHKVWNIMLVMALKTDLGVIYTFAMDLAHVSAYHLFSGSSTIYFSIYIFLVPFLLFTNSKNFELVPYQTTRFIMSLPVFKHFEKPWRIRGTYTQSQLAALVRDYGIEPHRHASYVSQMNLATDMDQRNMYAFYVGVLCAMGRGGGITGALKEKYVFDPDYAISASNASESAMLTNESQTVSYDLRVSVPSGNLDIWPNMQNNIFGIRYGNLGQFGYQIEPGKLAIGRHTFANKQKYTEEAYRELHGKVDLRQLSIYTIDNKKKRTRISPVINGLEPYIEGAENWVILITGLPNPIVYPILPEKPRTRTLIWNCTPGISEETSDWSMAMMLPDGRVAANTKAGDCGSPYMISLNGIWCLVGLHNASASHYISMLHPPSFRIWDSGTPSDVMNSYVNPEPMHDPTIFVFLLALWNRASPVSVSQVEPSLKAHLYNNRFGFGDPDLLKGVEIARLLGINQDDLMQRACGVLALNDDQLLEASKFTVYNQSPQTYSLFHSIGDLCTDYLKVKKITPQPTNEAHSLFETGKLHRFAVLLHECIVATIFIVAYNEELKCWFLVYFCLICTSYLKSRILSYYETLINTVIMVGVSLTFSFIYRNTGLYFDSVKFSITELNPQYLLRFYDYETLWTIILCCVSITVLSIFAIRKYKKDNKDKITTLIILFFAIIRELNKPMYLFYIIVIGLGGVAELIALGIVPFFFHQHYLTSGSLFLVGNLTVLIKWIYLHIYGEVHLFSRVIRTVDLEAVEEAPSDTQYQRLKKASGKIYGRVTSKQLYEAVEIIPDTDEFVKQLHENVLLLSSFYLATFNTGPLRTATLAVNTNTEDRLRGVFTLLKQFETAIPGLKETIRGEESSITFLKTMINASLESEVDMHDVNAKVLSGLFMAYVMSKVAEYSKISDIIKGSSEHCAMLNNLHTILQIDCDGLIRFRSSIRNLETKANADTIGVLYTAIRNELANLLAMQSRVRDLKNLTTVQIKDQAADAYFAAITRSIVMGLPRVLDNEGSFELVATVAALNTLTNLVKKSVDTAYVSCGNQATLQVGTLAEPLQTIIKTLLIVSHAFSTHKNESEVLSSAEEDLTNKINQLKIEINTHKSYLATMSDANASAKSETNKRIAQLEQALSQYNKTLTQERVKRENDQRVLMANAKKNAVVMAEQEREQRKTMEVQKQQDLLCSKLLRLLAGLSGLQHVSIPNALSMLNSMISGHGSIEVWSALLGTPELALTTSDIMAYNQDDVITHTITAQDYSKFTFWEFTDDSKQSHVFVGVGSKDLNVPSWYYVVSFNGETREDVIFSRLSAKTPGTIVLTRLLVPLLESLDVTDDQSTITVIPATTAVEVEMMCHYTVKCTEPHKHSLGNSTCRATLMRNFANHINTCSNCLGVVFGSRYTYKCGLKLTTFDNRAYVAHMITCEGCKSCDRIGCNGQPRTAVLNKCESRCYHGEAHTITSCTVIGCPKDHVRVESYMSPRSAPVKFTGGSITMRGEDYVLNIGADEAGFISKEPKDKHKPYDLVALGIKIEPEYKLYIAETHTQTDMFVSIYVLIFKYFNLRPKYKCECRADINKPVQHLYATRNENGCHSVDYNKFALNGFDAAIQYLPESAIAEIRSDYDDNKDRKTRFTSMDCLLRNRSGHANCQLCNLAPGASTPIPHNIKPNLAGLYFATKQYAIGDEACTACKGYKAKQLTCSFCTGKN